MLLNPLSEEDASAALDLATEFDDFIGNEDPVRSRIGEEFWCATLDAGLSKLYADAICAKNFFSRPLVRTITAGRHLNIMF